VRSEKKKVTSSLVNEKTFAVEIIFSVNSVWAYPCCLGNRGKSLMRLEFGNSDGEGPKHSYLPDFVETAISLDSHPPCLLLLFKKNFFQ
jgi:hypothetical protein